MKLIKILLLLFVIAIATSSFSIAAFYYCKGENGKVVIQSYECINPENKQGVSHSKEEKENIKHKEFIKKQLSLLGNDYKEYDEISDLCYGVAEALLPYGVSPADDEKSYNMSYEDCVSSRVKIYVKQKSEREKIEGNNFVREQMSLLGDDYHKFREFREECFEKVKNSISSSDVEGKTFNNCISSKVKEYVDQRDFNGSSEHRSSSIKDYCKKTVGDSYSLMETCINSELEAKTKIESKSVPGRIMSYCEKIVGDSYSLMETCIDSELEAKAKIDGID